jgi:hypothetical protein
MCISCPLHCFFGCASFGFKFKFKVQKHLNLQTLLSFSLPLLSRAGPFSSPFSFSSFPLAARPTASFLSPFLPPARGPPALPLGPSARPLPPLSRSQADRRGPPVRPFVPRTAPDPSSSPARPRAVPAASASGPHAQAPPRPPIRAAPNPRAFPQAAAAPCPKP